MDIQFYGANCIKISLKKANVVVDDNLSQLGAKTIIKPQDIELRTSSMIPVHESIFSADMPGEYEVSGVAIEGVGARAHMDEEGQKTATIFKIIADDLAVAVMGHIYPDLNDDQLEKLGRIDVMLVPVGGNGYTLDGVGALKLVKAVEPKIVIPTHYADKSLKFEVPQQPLEEALRALSMEPIDTVDKYKPKTIELSDTTKLLLLNRQ